MHAFTLQIFIEFCGNHDARQGEILGGYYNCFQVDGDRDYGNEVGIEKVRGIQELFQKKKG